MPLGKYYGGHGESVARDMKSRYGDRWERVFYGRANKTRKANPRKPRPRY